MTQSLVLRNGAVFDRNSVIIDGTLTTIRPGGWSKGEIRDRVVACQNLNQKGAVLSGQFSADELIPVLRGKEFVLDLSTGCGCVLL